MQCSVSALRQLLLDENMVNLHRAESLANIPLGLFRQLRGEQFKLHIRSRTAEEQYGSSALTCTIAIHYLEALLGNANINRYLRKYHEQTLQDCDRVVEESRIPRSNETEADVMKKQMWTITRAKANMQELLRRTKKIGPQIITQSGRPTAVLVSLPEWKQLTKRA
jgi:prevent-host-death family protein